MAGPTHNVREDELILLPESGGERGETRAMNDVEAEHAPILERELGRIMAYVVAGGVASAMLARADSLPTTGLLNAVNPLLKDAGNAGIRIQAALLERYGVGVPVSYAESLVAQWANRYDFNLVTGINRNSRYWLQHHISQWARSNEDLPALTKRLTPWFGKSRSELIASTEATRAFTEGTFVGWEAAGFNKRPIQANRPPAHPRCRCFVALRDGNPWEYVWYTVNDDLVCPICDPRHLTVIGIAGNP